MRGRRAFSELVDHLAEGLNPAHKIELRRVLTNWHRTLTSLDVPYRTQREALRVVSAETSQRLREGTTLRPVESQSAQVAVGLGLKTNSLNLTFYSFRELVQSARRVVKHTPTSKIRLYGEAFPRVWKLSDSFWVGRFTGKEEHLGALAEVGVELRHCYREAEAGRQYASMVNLFVGFDTRKRGGRVTIKPVWTAAISKLDHRLTEVREFGNVWIKGRNTGTFGAFLAKLQRRGRFKKVNDRQSSWPALQFFNQYNCIGTNEIQCPIQGSNGEIQGVIRHAGTCDPHNHPQYEALLLDHHGTYLATTALLVTPESRDPILQRLRASNPDFRLSQFAGLTDQFGGVNLRWRITDALLMVHVLGEALMRRPAPQDSYTTRVSDWNYHISTLSRHHREMVESERRRRQEAAGDDDYGDDGYDGGYDDDGY